MAQHTITLAVEEEFQLLVSDLGQETVSVILNTALRTEIDKRGRHQALGLFLDEIRSAYGEPNEKARTAATEAFDELEGLTFPLSAR